MPNRLRNGWIAQLSAWIGIDVRPYLVGGIFGLLIGSIFGTSVSLLVTRFWKPILDPPPKQTVSVSSSEAQASATCDGSVGQLLVQEGLRELTKRDSPCIGFVYAYDVGILNDGDIDAENGQILVYPPPGIKILNPEHPDINTVPLGLEDADAVSCRSLGTQPGSVVCQIGLLPRNQTVHLNFVGYSQEIIRTSKLRVVFTKKDWRPRYSSMLFKPLLRLSGDKYAGHYVLVDGAMEGEAASNVFSDADRGSNQAFPSGSFAVPNAVHFEALDEEWKSTEIQGQVHPGVGISLYVLVREDNDVFAGLNYVEPQGSSFERGAGHNCYESGEITINMDKTPPMLVVAADQLPNANGWNNSNVTVSFRESEHLGLATWAYDTGDAWGIFTSQAEPLGVRVIEYSGAHLTVTSSVRLASFGAQATSNPVPKRAEPLRVSVLGARKGHLKATSSVKRLSERTVIPRYDQQKE